MATPKPGEIRCPTCHRSTPPASFCTQCGSAIPTDARIRPRGLDRDELQERIRARRVGAEPYRRGAAAEAGYERFQPEPEDVAARQAAAATDTPRRDLLTEASPSPSGHDRSFQRGATGDLTRDRDDWDQQPREPVAVAPLAPPPSAPLRDYPDADDAVVDHRGDYATPAYGTADYSQYPDDPDAPGYEEWDEWAEEPERRSAGAGALAILGFLALGVLALLGGAVLAGVFGDEDPQVGIGASPSPSLAETAAPASAEPTLEPSGTAEPATSTRPRQSDEPVTFPDGFEAEVQPCLPGSANINGCNSNGSTNSGALDVWVGFRNGNEEDVISAEIVRADGSACGSGGTPSCGTGTIPLARIGCAPECRGGWTYIPFSGLPPGEYEVRVTRNGEPAGETTFVVS